MEGFLTFIIFVILGSYVVGFIAKFALKLYLKRVQSRFESFANGGGSAQYQQRTYNFGNRSSTTHDHKEGEVFISQQTESRNKKFKEDVGDYVDFEEVK